MQFLTNQSAVLFIITKDNYSILKHANYCPLLGSSGHSFSSAWLKKAYQRAKDEAEEEGKSLADVVAKRYGVSQLE